MQVPPGGVLPTRQDAARRATRSARARSNVPPPLAAATSAARAASRASMNPEVTRACAADTAPLTSSAAVKKSS